MHLGNLLFEGDEVNLIDFDDSGFAFLIYDIAAALAYSTNADNFPQLMRSMFEGYREIQDLPPDTDDLISPFIQLRLGGIVNWVLARSDNPHFRENGGPFVKSLCDRIRKLRQN